MSLCNLTRRLFSVSYQLSSLLKFNSIQRINSIGIKSISTTKAAYDVNEDVNKKLMEFFDDKKNWNENEVKHGRSWQLPELRIKSNTDLHKLWFVLMKERNMLMTMEHEYKDAWKWWASPERIDKVKESMRNIEVVVKERNRAYHELETGESGERPVKFVSNVLGVRAFTRLREHYVPMWRNKKWREENPPPARGKDMHTFLKLYREKMYIDKTKVRNRDKNHVIRLFRKYPNSNVDLLKEKYPLVNFNNLNRKDKFRGHYVPKID